MSKFSELGGFLKRTANIAAEAAKKVANDPTVQGAVADVKKGAGELTAKAGEKASQLATEAGQFVHEVAKDIKEQAPIAYADAKKDLKEVGADIKAAINGTGPKPPPPSVP